MFRRTKIERQREKERGERRKNVEKEARQGMERLRLVKLSYFNKTCRAKREDNEKI